MLDTLGDSLPILFVPDPILKAKCRPVGPQDNDTVRALLPRMFATMYQAPGIGLAAPQIGQKLRFVVVDVQPNEVRQPIALINPEIVARQRPSWRRARRAVCRCPASSPTSPARRGSRCATWTRPAHARRSRPTGLLSACLQHEIDHLDGVLFVDHLSALKRNMILRRLAKELRQRRDEDR